MVKETIADMYKSYIIQLHIDEWLDFKMNSQYLEYLIFRHFNPDYPIHIIKRFKLNG